jgi:YHS domain-containing protein
MVKDPVCGMEVNAPSAAATRAHMGHTYYFCAVSCAETFDAEPHRFAHGHRPAFERWLSASAREHAHQAEPGDKPVVSASRAAFESVLDAADPGAENQV